MDAHSEDQSIHGAAGDIWEFWVDYIHRVLEAYICALIIDKSKSWLEIFDPDEWHGTVRSEEGATDLLVGEQELVRPVAVVWEDLELNQLGIVNEWLHHPVSVSEDLLEQEVELKSRVSSCGLLI